MKTDNWVIFSVKSIFFHIGMTSVLDIAAVMYLCPTILAILRLLVLKGINNSHHWCVFIHLEIPKIFLNGTQNIDIVN